MCADSDQADIAAVCLNHTYLTGDQYILRGKASVCDASCVEVSQCLEQLAGQAGKGLGAGDKRTWPSFLHSMTTVNTRRVGGYRHAWYILDLKHYLVER